MARNDAHGCVTGWVIAIFAAILAVPRSTFGVEPELGNSSSTIGVTPAQVEEGRGIYATRCASCHGSELQGGAGLALSGSVFQTKWRGRFLRDLHGIVAQQMPLNAPGSLTVDESFDVLAFLLTKNGYAAGAAPLKRSSLYAVLFQQGADASLRPPASERSFPSLPADARVFAQASSDLPTAAELLADGPRDWLMYNKGYGGQRYSTLDQVNVGNAHELIAVCAFQLGQVGWYQASPIIYAGVLYVTSGNSTYAIDARTCRSMWQYDYVATEAPIVVVNRGVAIYKGALYRTTPTGHLISLDAKTGKLLWDVWVSNTALGYWLSAAPIVFEGTVVIGEAGADFGANGHVYGFDAANGKRLWTFDLVPIGREAGAATWGNGAATGGGSTWTSFSVDPAQGLIYAPIGNPAPDYEGDGRPGDNLYSDSIIALHAHEGGLAWYVQQLAHDVHDWDTSAPPALYTQGGRDYLVAATKGGWLYIYDRRTHALIARVEVSTHSNSDVPPSAEGVRTCPGNAGGVQWNGPAYSPKTKALYVNSVEWCGTYRKTESDFVRGGLYLGGDFTPDPRDTAKGWVRSVDAATGKPLWLQVSATPMLAGITPTAGDVLLTGDLNGNFIVLSAATGEILYQFATGGAIAGGVSTYSVDGKQFIAVASGNASRSVWGTGGAASVFVFGLRD
jgi:PQQ-dependent dehydrogenase (methanol/ethanol family)